MSCSRQNRCEQLQVFLLRMIRAAAAQVGLGDQAADPLADTRGQRRQFVSIGRQIERLAAARDVVALVASES